MVTRPLYVDGLPLTIAQEQVMGEVNPEGICLMTHQLGDTATHGLPGEPEVSASLAQPDKG
jgi:hypothetical protein